MANQNEAIPFISYELVTTDPISHFRGGSALIDETYQFDITVNSSDQGYQIMNILRHALEGYEGDMNGEWIQAVHLETSTLISQYASEASSEGQVYQYTTEYRFVREIQKPVLNT